MYSKSRNCLIELLAPSPTVLSAPSGNEGRVTTASCTTGTRPPPAPGAVPSFQKASRASSPRGTRGRRAAPAPRRRGCDVAGVQKPLRSPLPGAGAASRIRQLSSPALSRFLRACCWAPSLTTFYQVCPSAKIAVVMNGSTTQAMSLRIMNLSPGAEPFAYVLQPMPIGRTSESASCHPHRLQSRSASANEWPPELRGILLAGVIALSPAWPRP